MKKMIRTISVFLLLAMTVNTNAVAQKSVLDNHFDVVQKLSAIQSKSRQLVLIMRKKLADTPDLDSAKLLYVDLKAASDGVISRYKSIIDNPKMAKKQGEDITKNLNEVVDFLNKLTVFALEHGKQNMGLSPIAGLAIVNTVTEIGKGVYSEFKAMQKEKREATKAEVDQYILPDFDNVT